MAIVWGSGQDWNAPGGNTSSLNQNQNTQSTQSANKKKKKKKSQSQTGTWGDMAAANAAANLAGIVAAKPNLQNKAGEIRINPAVTGTIFDDYKEGDKLNAAQQVFKDFYGSSTPNAYQQAINDFITASPLNMQVYKDSGLKGAGLNAFMTTAPEAFASNTILGNILSNLASTPGNVREGLASLAKKDQGVLGFLASIPGNVAAQFTPSQAENVKNIAKERDSISNTLQTGPMDVDEYGGLGGDRFDVEEDVFESIFPNDPRIGVETVYTPDANPYPVDPREKDAMLKYVEKQNELMKEKYGGENIAQEVEEATESVVPGQFNLNYVRPDAPAINLSGVEDENVMDEFPKVKEYPVRDNEGVIQNAYYTDTGDFSNPGYFGYDYGIDDDMIFSDSISGMPKLGQEIRSADFSNFDYKDGGYLKQYDDGGYAKMSTFEKLKMMADNYGQ
jgi:hypothetical protein